MIEPRRRALKSWTICFSYEVPLCSMFLMHYQGEMCSFWHVKSSFEITKTKIFLVEAWMIEAQLQWGKEQGIEEFYLIQLFEIRHKESNMKFKRFPWTIPQVPFRMLVVQLTSHVSVVTLCGPTPSLADMIRSATSFWAPFYQVLEALSSLLPWNIAPALLTQLDNSVIG